MWLIFDLIATALIFLITAYGIKTDQLFLAIGLVAVTAFTMSLMLGASFVTVRSYGSKHEIISAIFSAVFSVFICVLSAAVLYAFRMTTQAT